MGYSGLVAREHSSGNRVQRGGITKTGNAHLQTGAGGGGVGVSASAECDRFSAAQAEGAGPQRRGQKDRLESATAAAQTLQGMAARGKNKNQIVTALGRELLGFIWAIAVKTEQQQKLAKAA